MPSEENKKFAAKSSIKYRIVLISIIVLLLFLASIPFKNYWFKPFCRPYEPLNYLVIYFSVLWLLGVACINKLVAVTWWKRILILSAIMHFVSLFIITFVLGFFHYDDYQERLVNSWNMSGGITYISVLVLVTAGSARSFMLGGWLFGMLTVVLFANFDNSES